MSLGEATMENNMEGPQKIENRTTIWSSNSTSGYYLKKTKALIQKDLCTPMFIAALFTIAKIWKQHKCPSVDEWIKKMWYIYTMEYHLAIKKEWNLAVCNNVDGPWGQCARWNKSDKERQILYDLTYMWNLKHNSKDLNQDGEVEGPRTHFLPCTHQKYIYRT